MLRIALITCLLIASVRCQDIPPSNLEDSSEIKTTTLTTIDPTSATTTTTVATTITTSVSSSTSDSMTSATDSTPSTVDTTITSTIPSTMASTTLSTTPSTTPSTTSSATLSIMSSTMLSTTPRTTPGSFITTPSTSSMTTEGTFQPLSTTTTTFPLKPYVPNIFHPSYCYYRSLRGHPKLEWSHYGCHWVHPTYCHRCCYYGYHIFAGCTNVDSYYCQKFNYNNPHNVFHPYSVNSLYY